MKLENICPLTVFVSSSFLRPISRARLSDSGIHRTAKKLAVASNANAISQHQLSKIMVFVGVVLTYVLRWGFIKKKSRNSDFQMGQSDFPLVV